MPVVYDLAGPEVHNLAADILTAHHPELIGPDGQHVRLCIMFAADPEGDGTSAVKCHGYPAAAVISVIPYKQRVDKRADAEIVVDQINWEASTDQQRRALLDHEITHLEFVKDENGALKTDDQNRPKIRLRLHDFHLGGFREIAQRYGGDAPEVRLAQDFKKRFGATLMPDEEAPLFAGK